MWKRWRKYCSVESSFAPFLLESYQIPRDKYVLNEREPDSDDESSSGGEFDCYKEDVLVEDDFVKL